jgi:hypothetical protein
MRDLWQFCHQAHPTPGEAREAVRLSGLRSTHTPAVLLLLRDRVEPQLPVIAGLRPRHERIRAFRLLLHLLAVADARRRRRTCADGCSHYWHHLPPAPTPPPTPDPHD